MIVSKFYSDYLRTHGFALPSSVDPTGRAGQTRSVKSVFTFLVR